MKFTSQQLKKANRRVIAKYGKNVLFNNDLSYTRVVFEVFSPSVEDKYVKDHLQSLLHTETSFEDVFYSI